MTDEAVTKWQPIAPLPDVNGAVAPLLKTADVLRAAWEDALRSSTSEEFIEARNRRLRRHAVETGIIERLYDLDWGTTEALVAEGITMDAANQAGGIQEETLLVIRSQYQALEYLTELAQQQRDLSIQTIRELHVLITRHQHTYDAHDQFGNSVPAPLHHGEWKSTANHVRRPDGSLLQYCPPEHVQAEMDRLVSLDRGQSGAHPIVRSAWLHHRFAQIHPFEDGNGRVARALTLLVLLQSKYAPLVVDRRQRSDYISSLDAANGGDLSDLIRFFARLEISALQSTLTQPISPSTERDAVGVARSFARRFQEIRNATSTQKIEGVRRVAEEVSARICAYLEGQRKELLISLHEVDPSARATLSNASPPDDKSSYWKRQLVQSARTVDFYANLSNGSWWSALTLKMLGERLQFIAAIQKVGHGDTGIMAVTVYAEMVHPSHEVTSAAVGPEPILDLSPTDSVTLSHSEDPSERWPEIEELLREKMREAMLRFIDRLG